MAETSQDPEKLLEVFRNAVPMRRIGRPEDYPGIITMLASDEASFITGQVISVSGGLTMAVITANPTILSGDLHELRRHPL